MSDSDDNYIKKPNSEDSDDSDSGDSSEDSDDEIIDENFKKKLANEKKPALIQKCKYRGINYLKDN